MAQQKVSGYQDALNQRRIRLYFCVYVRLKAMLRPLLLSVFMHFSYSPPMHFSAFIFILISRYLFLGIAVWLSSVCSLFVLLVRILVGCPFQHIPSDIRLRRRYPDLRSMELSTELWSYVLHLCSGRLLVGE